MSASQRAKSPVLALDPGTTETGWCHFFDGRICASGIAENAKIIDMIQFDFDDTNDVAIEMVACYGMPVGKEVFETCVWIGRFYETALRYRLNGALDVPPRGIGQIPDAWLEPILPPEQPETVTNEETAKA